MIQVADVDWGIPEELSFAQIGDIIATLYPVCRMGQPNTTTNIEHRMEAIYRNAGLTHLKGGVHILRKTFSTVMYENGARVKEIAAYIGDLESTVERYYIAIRKKRTINGKEEHIVTLPKSTRFS